MKSSAVEKTRVDLLNEAARKIVKVLTGWDAVPNHGQFYLETPLFSGWREQQESTAFVGAWYHWFNGSSDGVYIEVCIEFNADQRSHESILRCGLNDLYALVKKENRPAVGVPNGSIA